MMAGILVKFAGALSRFGFTVEHKRTVVWCTSKGRNGERDCGTLEKL